MNGEISFADVVRVVLPRDSLDGVVAMLTAYFDDSGTHADSDVVVIGGLIGGERQWTPFEAAWKAKLAEPLPGKPPLSRFHMAPCVAGDGEFVGYSDGERDAVIHDFRQIILDAHLLGYSCAVSLKDWDEIIGTRSYEGLKSPEFYCMSQAIIHSCRIARMQPIDKIISLVFNDQREHRERNEHLFSLYHTARNLTSKGEEVVGVSFFSSRGFVPLQGADMLAWETYNYAHAWLCDGRKPPRPHLARFIETEKFIAHIAGRPAIEDIAEWLAGLQGE